MKVSSRDKNLFSWTRALLKTLTISTSRGKVRRLSWSIWNCIIPCSASTSMLISRLLLSATSRVKWSMVWLALIIDFRLRMVARISESLVTATTVTTTSVSFSFKWIRVCRTLIQERLACLMQNRTLPRWSYSSCTTLRASTSGMPPWTQSHATQSFNTLTSIQPSGTSSNLWLLRVRLMRIEASIELAQLISSRWKSAHWRKALTQLSHLTLQALSVCPLTGSTLNVRITTCGTYLLMLAVLL